MVLWGCDGPPPAAPTVSTATGGADPQTGVVRYLALGDSVSQGIGAKDPETGSFPALLAEKWRAKGCQVELKNPAVAGYEADDVVREELPEIAAFKPTLITFQVGANDIVNGVQIETYRQNIRTILDAAKASGARVLVLPMNEWFRSPQGRNAGRGLSTKRAAFDDVLLEETQAKAAEWVDLRLLYRQEADANQWFAEDGIHPTGDCYAAWAAEIARVIPAPCGKK